MEDSGDRLLAAVNNLAGDVTSALNDPTTCVAANDYKALRRAIAFRAPGVILAILNRARKTLPEKTARELLYDAIQSGTSCVVHALLHPRDGDAFPPLTLDSKAAREIARAGNSLLLAQVLDDMDVDASAVDLSEICFSAIRGRAPVACMAAIIDHVRTLDQRSRFLPPQVLYCAIRESRTPIACVEALLDSELVDPAAGNNHALKLAVMDDAVSVRVLDLLLRHRDVNPADQGGIVLLAAVYGKNVDKVRRLINDSRAVNGHMVDVCAAFAARTGDLDILQLLLTATDADPMMCVTTAWLQDPKASTEATLQVVLRYGDHRLDMHDLTYFIAGSPYMSPNRDRLMWTLLSDVRSDPNLIGDYMSFEQYTDLYDHPRAPTHCEFYHAIKRLDEEKVKAMLDLDTPGLVTGRARVTALTHLIMTWIDSGEGRGMLDLLIAKGGLDFSKCPPKPWQPLYVRSSCFIPSHGEDETVTKRRMEAFRLLIGPDVNMPLNDSHICDVFEHVVASAATDVFEIMQQDARFDPRECGVDVGDLWDSVWSLVENFPDEDKDVMRMGRMLCADLRFVQTSELVAKNLTRAVQLECPSLFGVLMKHPAADPSLHNWSLLGDMIEMYEQHEEEDRDPVYFAVLVKSLKLECVPKDPFAWLLSLQDTTRLESIGSMIPGDQLQILLAGTDDVVKIRWLLDNNLASLTAGLLSPFSVQTKPLGVLHELLLGSDPEYS